MESSFRMMSSEPPAPSATDTDLAALPAPRRPFRRFTLVLMAFTALFALNLAVGLRGELTFSLLGGSPRDIGSLSPARPGQLEANTWVRAEGELSSSEVIRYARPLESGEYRLAPLEGNRSIWVELRLPPDAASEHFVAPASFVGRLVPVRSAGIRYQAVRDAAGEVGHALPPDAWLLIDGESPAGLRWVIGLEALLIGFTAFNLLGLVRLARPVRDG